jgi:two-component system KDP operon response regulator KdpE
VRQAIAWILEGEGIPVVQAGDGGTALRLAQKQRPALVVLDIGLPDINGRAVAAELHLLYRGEVPILAITADGRAASKARQVGAYSYLSKPFDLDAFVAAVRQGLDALP